MLPRLIGIAGRSGSGKSELAHRLAAALPGTTALVSLDSYYRPLSHLDYEERTRVNFDHPGALDWERIRADVRRLAAGQAIDEPIYWFDVHTRATESRHVEPADYVILEGLFALYDREVRNRFAARLFVEAPDSVCLERRMARDVLQRGRTPESVTWQYETTVRPMAEQYVLPTREYADLMVSGVDSIENSVRAALRLLDPR